MAEPTPYEQQLLELINRARTDPAGELGRLVPGTSPVKGATSDITNALTFFKVDLAAVAQQLQGVAAVAPLAWNTNLDDAAAVHSANMIKADSQSHQVAGEADLGQRVQASGYIGWTAIAENIFAFATDPVSADAAFFIDWTNATANGIQNPPGHRINMLSASYTEVGIHNTPEANAATSVGPNVVTEDFGARSGYKPQFVGVVYRDTNASSFYDAGEGVGGVTVTATGTGGTFSTTTWASGGYQFAAPTGTYTITFSGGGLTSPITQQATIGSQNVKVDEKIGAVTAPSADNTTGAALLLFYMNKGATPDKAGLDSLSATAASLISQAGGNPNASWQQLGASLTDSKFNTNFLAKYAPLSNADLIKALSLEIFGAAPTDFAQGYFQNLVSYYQGYYAQFADATDPTGLTRAKGTLIGDMLKQAMDAHVGKYPVAETAFLDAAAKGTAVYGGDLFTTKAAIVGISDMLPVDGLLI